MPAHFEFIILLMTVYQNVMVRERSGGLYGSGPAEKVKFN